MAHARGMRGGRAHGEWRVENSATTRPPQPPPETGLPSAVMRTQLGMAPEYWSRAETGLGQWLEQGEERAKIPARQPRPYHAGRRGRGRILSRSCLCPNISANTLLELLHDAVPSGCYACDAGSLKPITCPMLLQNRALRGHVSRANPAWKSGLGEALGDLPGPRPPRPPP